MRLLDRRRALISKAMGGFTKYQFVEYIESTGTQWIDTGFKPNQDTTIEMDYQLTTAETDRYLFGTRGNASSNYRLMYYIAINSSNKYVVGHNELLGNVFAYQTTPNTDRHIMHRNKGTIYIDNKIAHGFNAEVTFECVNNLEIFACYNNREGVNPVKMRLYSFKIFEGGLNGNGGALLMDFIPCYRTFDNKPGLYDAVNDVFYTNQGTGEFILGPNV